MTPPDDTAPTESTAPTDSTAPAAPAEAEDGGPGETAGALLESAAEIAIGAAVAPFTGGETVGIVASLTEALEGGVDRLTHLGHHPDAPVPSESDANEPTDPPA